MVVFQPADHDLMAGPAFGLGPALRPSRPVRRVQLLRHHAFKLELAGRLQHGVAAALEMLDIADLVRFPLLCLQQLLEPRLTLPERKAAIVAAFGEQEIEGKEDEVLGLAIRQRGLERGKVRRAVVVERDNLAVDHGLRQRIRLLRDGGELVGPVETLAGLQRRLAVLDAKLHAVAIELDLVAPAVAGRRTLDRRAELRRDEIRHLRDRLGVRSRRGTLLCGLVYGLAALQRRAWRRRDGPPLRLLDAVGLPHSIGLTLGTLRQHERLWRAALAFGDLRHRAAGGD
ncbi:hypothetical protein ACVJMY_008017 [Bradyrhizobium diazoefficiens]